MDIDAIPPELWHAHILPHLSTASFIPLAAVSHSFRRLAWAHMWQVLPDLMHKWVHQDKETNLAAICMTLAPAPVQKTLGTTVWNTDSDADDTAEVFEEFASVLFTKSGGPKPRAPIQEVPGAARHLCRPFIQMLANVMTPNLLQWFGPTAVCAFMDFAYTVPDLNTFYTSLTRTWMERLRRNAEPLLSDEDCVQIIRLALDPHLHPGRFRELSAYTLWSSVEKPSFHRGPGEEEVLATIIGSGRITLLEAGLVDAARIISKSKRRTLYLMDALEAGESAMVRVINDIVVDDARAFGPVRGVDALWEWDMFMGKYVSVLNAAFRTGRRDLVEAIQLPYLLGALQCDEAVMACMLKLTETESLRPGAPNGYATFSDMADYVLSLTDPAAFDKCGRDWRTWNVYLEMIGSAGGKGPEGYQCIRPEKIPQCMELFRWLFHHGFLTVDSYTHNALKPFMLHVPEFFELLARTMHESFGLPLMTNIYDRDRNPDPGSLYEDDDDDENEMPALMEMSNSPTQRRRTASVVMQTAFEGIGGPREEQEADAKGPAPRIVYLPPAPHYLLQKYREARVRELKDKYTVGHSWFPAPVGTPGKAAVLMYADKETHIVQAAHMSFRERLAEQQRQKEETIIYGSAEEEGDDHGATGTDLASLYPSLRTEVRPFTDDPVDLGPPQDAYPRPDVTAADVLTSLRQRRARTAEMLAAAAQDHDDGDKDEHD